MLGIELHEAGRQSFQAGGQGGYQHRLTKNLLAQTSRVLRIGQVYGQQNLGIDVWYAMPQLAQVRQAG